MTANHRIEWCNETAAVHFGFDSQRDVMQHIGNLLRDPLFASYLASDDYLHEIVIIGPRSSTSRPVRLAVHLHRYGEGRKLLLSRDVTALEQAETMRRDFRRQCIARNPHAADGAYGLCGNIANPATR